MNEFISRIPFEQRTVHSLLERAAAERPEVPFFRWAGQTYSVGDVNARANQLARSLRQCGVSRGTRVAAMMDNGPEYLYLWFALAKLGAVEISINTAFIGELLAHQLAKCEASLAVVDAAYRPRFEQLMPELPHLRSLVVHADSPSNAGPHRDFSELLTGGDDDLGVEVDPADLGCIIYTSGTTGPSKGVMLSRHHECTFGMLYTEIIALTGDDVVLNYLPYFHIAGKFVTTGALLTAAPLVLVPRLSIESFWDDVRAHGITTFVAVGGVCNMLHGRPPRPGDADNPVRVVYAVPAPAEIYEDFERRFGLKLVEAYGSTETNLVVHTALSESVPGSCGRAHELFDVRVVDEHDQEVPDGESGEIVVRPRLPYTTLLGYDALPEQTTQAWRNLWFHTGDRGRRDEQGYFYFLDRVKDSIRRRGENISSFEVERLVGGHPAVAEVAAVGVPSELGEEEVKVVVVRRADAEVTHEELLEYCAATMPYFMVPRYIEFADELERTPTNKVEKYKLRAMGIGGETWDCEQAGWRITRKGLARKERART